jgi:PAS domain S-box-containing protein
MYSISDRLRSVRERTGLSVRGFATALEKDAGYGVSHSSVSEYEGGRTVPANYIAAVLRAFQINPTWLLTGEGLEAMVPPEIEQRAFEEIATVVDRYRPAPSGAEIELRLFFELSPQLFAIASDGYLVRLNDAWHEVLGWEPNDLVSRPLAEFVHPGDRKEFEATYESLMSGSLHRDFRVRFQHADGSIRWLSCNCRGVSGKIYFVTHDVTEARERQLELEARAAKFSRVVANCPHGILVHLNGTIVLGNPGACQVLATDGPGELEGEPIWGFFPPEQRDFLQRGFERSEGTPARPFRIFEIFPRRGASIPAEVAALPILYGEDEAIQVVIHPLVWWMTPPTS